MNLRTDLRTAILGDQAVVALISDRCYPDRLPQGATFPCVVFLVRTSEDDSEYRTHDLVPVSRAVARSQVSAYAGTGDEAAQLAAHLVAFLSNYRGGCIGHVVIANRIDTIETSVDRFRNIIDLLVDYER